MGKSKLYAPVMLRFSLVKNQHVKAMNMLEELANNGERSKNQIIVDALEYYFEQMTDGQFNGRTFIDQETFESRLAKEKEEIRKEIYQDVIQFIAGSALRGASQPVVVAQPEQNHTESEDNYSEFGNNGVMMKDVMKWS